MKKLLVILLLIFAKSAVAQQFSNYKKDKEFGKLRITIDELKKVVASIKYYKDEYPIDTIDRFNSFSISCEIKKNNESQTYQGFDQISTIELDEKVYTELNIDYNFSRQAISSVSLTLSGIYRKLSVSGKDKVKVDALFRALDDEISSHESMLNFIDWEFVLMSAMIALFFGSVLFLTSAKLNNPTPEATSIFIKIKLICGIYILLCLIFLITPLKIRDMFPGFQLVSEEVNWWDKYGNLISIVVLFSSMLGAAYKYVSNLLRLVPFNSPTTSDQSQIEQEQSTEVPKDDEIDRTA